MTEPCPFCGFEASDFRKSFNWHCSECDKDYADWVADQKKNTLSKQRANEESPIKKQAIFSPRKIPVEAEPVKFAQSLITGVILLLVALNFFIDGVFSWVFPVSIPLAGYYAFTIHKTGYALGQHTVYQRDKNPIMHKVFFWAAIVYMLVAMIAWIN